MKKSIDEAFKQIDDEAPLSELEERKRSWEELRNRAEEDAKESDKEDGG